MNYLSVVWMSYKLLMIDLVSASLYLTNLNLAYQTTLKEPGKPEMFLDPKWMSSTNQQRGKSTALRIQKTGLITRRWKLREKTQSGR